MAELTKLEAAQRQLDCAIRLLFNLDDMPSIITLSRAAFRILFDIYPVLKPDGKYSSDLDGVIKRMGWSKFKGHFRRIRRGVPPLIGHTSVSSAVKSSLCWQTLAKRSDRISRVTLLTKLAIRPTNWAAV